MNSKNKRNHKRTQLTKRELIDICEEAMLKGCEFPICREEFREIAERTIDQWIKNRKL